MEHQPDSIGKYVHDLRNQLCALAAAVQLEDGDELDAATARIEGMLLHLLLERDTAQRHLAMLNAREGII